MSSGRPTPRSTKEKTRELALLNIMIATMKEVTAMREKLEELEEERRRRARHSQKRGQRRKPLRPLRRVPCRREMDPPTDKGARLLLHLTVPYEVTIAVTTTITQRREETVPEVR